MLSLMMGSAGRAAELMVCEGVLGLRVGIEKVARGQRAVAEYFDRSCRELIGAALGDDVYGGTGAAAELGLRVAGDGDLGQRVDGKNGSGGAPDARLVYRRQIAVAIVHVGAVEQIVIGAAAVAVEAEQDRRSRPIRSILPDRWLRPGPVR